MLKFKELNENSFSELSSCYKRSTYKISDYSVGIKYMWKDLIDPEYCISDGCLIVSEVFEDVLRFNFPLPIEENANVRSALASLEEYCKENFIPFELDYVPGEYISLLTELYDRISISPTKHLCNHNMLNLCILSTF